MTNLYAESFPPEPVPLTNEEKQQLFEWLCDDFDGWTAKDHARAAMDIPPHELRELHDSLAHIMQEDEDFLNSLDDEDEA